MVVGNITVLTDEQMRRSVHLAALLTMTVPPLVGGTLMGLMGFYPLPEFYLIFTDYRVILYVAIAMLLSQFWAVRTANFVESLIRMDLARAQSKIQRCCSRFPLILAATVTFYSVGGVLSADIALETMRIREYGLRDHLNNQLGVLPVVLVTVFPIFFYLVDRIGRYLGPRGISVVAMPLWIKLLMVGIVTPLLIESVLVGYYVNLTGNFEWEMALLWLALAGFAAGSTWLAWRSLRQGLTPLQMFIAAKEDSISERARSTLTPLSLDEFGVLTSRYHELLTNRAALSEKLVRAESLANTAIDVAGALVVMLDREGRIQRFNRACEQLSGYTFSEVEGKYPWDMLLPPEDADTIRSESFEALTQNPQAMSGRYTNLWVSKNGARHLIEWSNTLMLNADGELEFMVSVGIDVTERLRNEHELKLLNETLESRVLQRTFESQQQFQRLEALLSNMQDGFFSADTSGRIRHVNPAFCTLLGYTEAELLAMSIPDIEASKNAEGVAAHIRKVLENGFARFETWYQRKDGSLVEMELSVNLVKIAGSRMFYAFARDLTSRRIAESSLRQARDDAEQANAAKSEFLSRMSHELRTPLNAILGFSQILQLPSDHPLSEQQAENVEEIRKGGVHLLRLVNEVLDLARIESGHIELNLEPVLIATLADDCFALLRPMAETRGISMAAVLDPAQAVLGDYTRLKQVLLNLLANAIKYNREGGTIRLAATAAGAHLRVEVHDSGRGIATDRRAMLFKPFQRLESSLDGIEGVGIGLALVKRLVEAMGGEVGVESELGVGSIFWFSLLVAEPPKTHVTPLQNAMTDSVSTARQTVLCIEDNQANLKLLGKLLGTRPELQMIHAPSAECGLSLALARPPSLILLDINLPGMDGYAALAELKTHPVTASIPVIAITANAMARDIERGRAAGFSEYLTKPINFSQFFAILDQHLTKNKGSQA